MREVFRRLGSIQFDPLGVAGRNHDLVLHARVAGYDPAWCEELLYQRRELFEAYNKGLSLLPTPELPWFRVPWRLDAPSHENRVLAANAEFAKQVLERIRAEGPLSTLDFERGATVEWFWAPTSVARAVLETYTLMGVLGLSRREGNRRYYDLVERLFPAELLAHRVPLREQVRHKLLSRYRAHGLLGKSGSSELWFGTGNVKPDPDVPGHPTRTELREELIAEGELVPVEIEGVRGERFVLRDELGMLFEAARRLAVGRVPRPARSAGLGPHLLRTLFDFDYIWEVYVPERKRRWGYYVLPVLFGDRLVGRIEPRIDRAAGVIRILRVWWEDGFEPAPG